MSGKKIKDCQENPLDAVLYNIAIYITNPIFYKMGLTPNWITTFSMITGLLSAYMLYIGRIYWSAGLWLLSYFFDCSDGAMARKYQMYSKFGDIYDHFSDITKFIFLYIVLFIRVKEINSIIRFTTIILIFTILNFIHLGCQEKIYDKPVLTMNMLRHICPNKNNIYITKMFGPGTLNIVIILVIIFHARI
jgi:phosphatidylglycerophosphate synthase